MRESEKSCLGSQAQRGARCAKGPESNIVRVRRKMTRTKTRPDRALEAILVGTRLEGHEMAKCCSRKSYDTLQKEKPMMPMRVARGHDSSIRREQHQVE